MNAISPGASEQMKVPKAEIFPTDAYVSPDYARREFDRLWTKIWQYACRLEELPTVGSYITYEILDQSIIVVRSDKGIRAFYNSCTHRGRRLTQGCGHTARFTCRFHGWQFGLNGEPLRVVDREDWGDALTDENLALVEVKADVWGGYVFLNLDPECEPLRDFLEPAASMLDPFEIDRMRFRWRKGLTMPCNWKVALEAFSEAYHTQTTHPQMMRWVDDRTWSKVKGKHGHHGFLPYPEGRLIGQGSPRIMAAPREDYRESLADYFLNLRDTLDAFATRNLVDAAARLPVEMPESATPFEVLAQMMDWARAADLEGGVVWPDISPEHLQEAGYDWHVFPNSVILVGPTFVLGYRARPNGYNPDSCIFEVYALDRAPEGVEPPLPPLQTCDDMANETFWGKVLTQDFSNMEQVQLGLKNRGLRGVRPGPIQEASVVAFRRALSGYMDD